MSKATDGECAFNVDQTVLYPAPRQGRLPMFHRKGRPPGHAVPKDEIVRKLNLAVRDLAGPAYKWWAARELGVSEPTLRAMLQDYALDWPPPWPPAN